MACRSARDVAGVTVLGGAAALAWVLPHTLTAGPVLCPFRRLTGLPCPGCGLTRSVVALVHGDLHASLHAHPFGVVVVVLALVAAGHRLVRSERIRLPQPVVLAGWAALAPPWVVWSIARMARA